jgi:hypothetical protein
MGRRAKHLFLKNWSGEQDSNLRVRFGRPPYLPLYDHRPLALGGEIKPNLFEALKAPGLPLADPRTNALLAPGEGF